MLSCVNTYCFAFNPTMVWFYPKLFVDLNALLNFQSHYGLILSKLDSVVDWLKNIPFNPTMVWFYHSTKFSERCLLHNLSIPLWSDFIIPVVVKATGWIVSFQSHYGLILSYPYQIANLPDVTSFQSHYGLILSNPPYNVLFTGALSIPLWSDFIQARLFLCISVFLTFNPTMVWFYLVEELRGEYKGIADVTFNPTMVWFYHESPFVYFTSVNITFNPTMVWFYPSSPSSFLKYLYFFQSHYGLILSHRTSRMQFMLSWSFNPTMVWFYLLKFKSNPVWRLAFNPTMVWFYQITRQNRFTVDVQAFNPTMVWFYRKWDIKKLLYTNWTFNPTMVWFYHFTSSEQNAELLTLSIPLWSDFILMYDATCLANA